MRAVLFGLLRTPVCTMAPPFIPRHCVVVAQISIGVAAPTVEEFSMKRTHLVLAIMVASLVPPATDLQAQIGRGRQERVEDRAERRTERQINRNERGYYFNDASWTQLEPWFQQYQIGPVTVTGRAGVDTRWGYADQTPDDDWFYDWYDYGHSWYYPAADNRVAWGYHYYDRNGDGIYDWYYSSSDRDNDGIYDAVDEYQFGVAVEGQRDTEATVTTFNPPEMAGTVEVSGEVTAVKSAKVRGAEHMLLDVQATGEQAGDVFVDAGPVSEISARISIGDTIQATGRNVDMGEKTLFVASSLVVNGETVNVSRRGEPITGTIVETDVVEIHGVPHTMAVVMAGDEHRLVDLGPEAELKVEFQPQSEIRIYGVPVQMRDRPVYMAHEIEYDGRELTIMRSTTAPAEPPRDRR
jgi:hypothetical protein